MLYATLYMPALRTQIYLTAEQRKKLAALQRRDGRSLAEHVRAALDAYLTAEAPDLESALDETFGAVPGLTAPSRDAWDRG